MSVRMTIFALTVSLSQGAFALSCSPTDVDQFLGSRSSIPSTCDSKLTNLTISRSENQPATLYTVSVINDIPFIDGDYERATLLVPPEQMICTNGFLTFTISDPTIGLKPYDLTLMKADDGGSLVAIEKNLNGLPCSTLLQLHK